MARTMVLVAPLLLLLLLVLVMRNRATLECRSTGIDVQAEAGAVLGSGVMPPLECRAIEVHVEEAETGNFISVANSLDGSADNFHFEGKKLGYRPSDSELDVLKRSGYGDIRESRSSLAECPAQLLEEAPVKQLAGKKGWTPVVHQLQVPMKVSAYGLKRIIPEAAGFPCNQENIYNPYGDVRGSHSILAESPAQLQPEEAPVKQLAGKKVWTPVVHQLQVPPKISADGWKRIISEAAEFPCNQENIYNPSKNQVVDFSSLDQWVRPGVRSSYGTAGSVKVFRNEFLRSDDTPAQDAVKVFCNEFSDSFVPSPDHDTSAHDAGTVKVISTMILVVLLWTSVGIKWKMPRKVHIGLTGLLLASITHYGESAAPPQAPPPTAVVQFDIKNFEPTFIQQRDELVVKPNCPVVDGHYIMPKEEYVKGGQAPPPRWIRIDSTGETGKQSSVVMRGDTNYLLSFVDGAGLVHFMGADNAVLFPGAHMLPFKETYPSLFDIEDEGLDTVKYLMTIPLGKAPTEVANTILSDYTLATPVENVRRAILTYVITFGESQRIKSLGDRLRKNWDETTFLTEEEANNILIWARLCGKWCSQDLGELKNAFNLKLQKRGLFDITAINNTIDLVKWPRKKRGRCELPQT